MSKAKLNYLVDLMLFLSVLFEGVSGFILWFVLPRGRGGGKGIEVEADFLFSRDMWITLHDWVGVVLVIAVIIHLILHWKWIVHMTKSFFKQPN